MNALEVKEDGQIWLNDGQQSILVSNQDVAMEMIYKVVLNAPVGQYGHPLLNPGIYPIPDLKWERKGVCCSPLAPNISHHGYCDECDKYFEVAVIIQEDETFNGCSPTACGCKSLADCPNNQPLAVATFVIQEDEKNGMYEESQEELWNDIFQNYMIWQDQEPKLSDLLKDFRISRR